MHRAIPNPILRGSIAALFPILVLGFAVASAGAQTEKPRLSGEISRVMEEDGPEAAQRRFDEIFPENQGDWTIDPEGLTEVALGYMQKGDMLSAQPIMMMVAAITQQFITSGNPMIPAAPPSGSSSSTASPASTAASTSRGGDGRGPDLGPSRDDLERFVGEYGHDPLRRFMVAIGCTGHLVAGATWGDASNWWLRSESDLAFSYEDEWTNLQMSFVVDSDGEVVSVTQNLDMLPSSLERFPLREEWARECVRPPWG